MQKKEVLRLLFTLLLASIHLISNAQLTVSDTFKIENLVKKVLLGGGVKIFNIKYTGSSHAIGTFSGRSNIDIEKGVILSTGKINSAPGPNVAGGGAVSGGLNSPRDSLLSFLIQNQATYDAAILEFDFIPVTDRIQFNYVFASEQYPEQVCSRNSDVFGFFLSGRNPQGGFYKNKNIALIPDSETPVAINTINNGIPGSGATGIPWDDKNCNSLDVNWKNNNKYYVDNGDGSRNHPSYYDKKVVQYDGFTKKLKATAKLVPCEVYHIKIAVADIGDEYYDTGVFLEAKSFSGGLDIKSDSEDSRLVEGCKPITLNFIRYKNLDSLITIRFQMKGLAENGPDFTGQNNQKVPDSITFYPITSSVLPEADTVQLLFYPIYDQESEGDEEILIDVVNPLGCQYDTIKLKFILSDTQTLRIEPPADTTLCSGTPYFALVGATGGIEPYLYYHNNKPIHNNRFESSFEKDTVIELSVKDKCGIKDSATFKITINSSPDSDFTHDNFCVNTSGKFQSHYQTSQSLIDSLVWMIENTKISKEEQFIHTFDKDGEFKVELYTFSQNGCKDSIVKSIEVNPLPFVAITGLDSNYCESSTSIILQAIPSGGEFYGRNVQGGNIFHRIQVVIP